MMMMPDKVMRRVGQLKDLFVGPHFAFRPIHISQPFLNINKVFHSKRLLFIRYNFNAVEIAIMTVAVAAVGSSIFMRLL